MTLGEPICFFDTQATRNSFPMLDNGYIFLAGTKMSVFSNGANWVLAVEIGGFHYKYYSELGFRNDLYLFGDILRLPSVGVKQFSIHSIRSASSQRLMFDDVTIDTSVRSVEIYEESLPLQIDSDFFSTAGVPVRLLNKIHPTEFQRALLFHHPDKLFIRTDALTGYFSRNVPMLLQLFHWHHPDVKSGELPSSTKTFRMISDVLITGNPMLYDENAEVTNTHWTNWPLAGTL